MHLFHIPQCIIQNRNVHISVLNGAFWDMEQMYCGIFELNELSVLYGNQEILAIQDIYLKRIFNPHLAKSCLFITSVSAVRSLRNFAQSMAVILFKNSKQFDNWAISYGQMRFMRFEFKTLFGRILYLSEMGSVHEINDFYWYKFIVRIPIRDGLELLA